MFLFDIQSFSLLLNTAVIVGYTTFFKPELWSIMGPSAAFMDDNPAEQKIVKLGWFSAGRIYKYSAGNKKFMDKIWLVNYHKSC